MRAPLAPRARQTRARQRVNALSLRRMNASQKPHWFLHQMIGNYHTPLTFRFSANAFLSALKSVVDLLRLDLERTGENEWRQRRFEEMRSDRVLEAFSRGRNIVLHQRPLVQSSRVEVGLFKYKRQKIAFGWNRRPTNPV